MGYASLFGGSTVAPSNLTYLNLAISADVTLAWPIEQSTSTNVVADIVDITPAVSGLNVNLSDARQVSTGIAALFNNIGSQTVTIRDSAGGTLVSLASGTVWQLYLADNSTSAGTWRAFQFGASVSVTNAAALAGAGLKAISTTLNEQLTATSVASSPVNVVNNNRAQVIRWTGAAGTLNLPAVATVGADWFVIVRNDGSGDLAVTPAAGTIDGSATKTFAAGTSAWVVSDGTNWFTLGFGAGVSGGSSFDFVQIDVSGSGNFTLSGVQLNRVSYRFIGALTGDRSIIVPNAIQQYWVTNATTGAFNLFVKTAAQVTPVQILQNNSGITYCDGTNVIDAESSTVTFPISVALGGTGANNAATARTNLGVTTAVPTGLVGPTATTGSVGTFMDSGSAPAINLTTDYTWAGKHAYSFAVSSLNWPIFASSATPGFLMRETDAASDNQYWGYFITGETAQRILLSNAGAGVAYETINRTGNTPDDVTWVFTTVTFTSTTINLNCTNLRKNGVDVALTGTTVNSQSGNYTTVLADANNIVLHPNGAGTGDTFTIAANASVAYTVGTAINFVNRDAGSVSIAIAGGDTLVWTGTTSTGTRTLLQNGIATAVKIEATVWMISGAGLT